MRVISCDMVGETLGSLRDETVDLYLDPLIKLLALLKMGIYRVMSPFLGVRTKFPALSRGMTSTLTGHPSNVRLKIRLRPARHDLAVSYRRAERWRKRAARFQAHRYQCSNLYTVSVAF